jgi:hypothetical protein
MLPRTATQSRAILNQIIPASHPSVVTFDDCPGNFSLPRPGHALARRLDKPAKEEPGRAVGSYEYGERYLYVINFNHALGLGSHFGMCLKVQGSFTCIWLYGTA